MTNFIDENKLNSKSNKYVNIIIEDGNILNHGERLQ